MILYSALKYTILDICLDSLFKSIYKNIKPNLLLSAGETISLIEGMYFDRIECHSRQRTDKFYGVRICQVSYNKIRITYNAFEVYVSGDKFCTASGQTIEYTIRFFTFEFEKIDYYINDQHFYMMLRPIPEYIATSTKKY